MTKTNSKKALLSSAFALVLSIAMLIGTTFAWFTDTASTGVNKIQAGTLKIDIVDAETKASIKNSELKFVSADNVTKGEDILWEPNATYKTTGFKIKNDGNLALKYKMMLNGIKGDSMLLDVIKFSVVNEEGAAVDIDSFEGYLTNETDTSAYSETLYIQGHMDANAGNDYQGKTLEGLGITVLAAQYTYESDSFDNQYDKNALYPDVTVIDKGEGKADEALSQNDEIINVALQEDVSVDVKPYDQKPLGGDKTKLIIIDGQNHKLTFNNTNSDWNNVTWGNAKLIIKNAAIDNSGYNADGGPWNSHDISFKGELVLENVTFTNAVALSGKATLKNVSIEDKNATGDTYMLWICAGSEVVAENLTINGKSAVGHSNRAIAIKDQYITDPQPTVLTIKNAAISSDKYAAVYVTSASATTVNLEGVIDVTDTAVNDKVVEGSGVTVNDNSTKAVKTATQTEMNDAITGSTGSVALKLAKSATVTLDNGIAHEGSKSRNVTFVGDGTQTVDVITKSINAEGGQLNYQRGSVFTFENTTVQAGEGSFDGIVCDEIILKNCTVKGKLTLYGKATFIDCKFENDMADQYSIWTWGGTDVTVKNCVFNTNGKAILLYGQATAAKPTNLTVTDCTFNDRNNGSAGKAAIEIGNDYNATYKLIVNNVKVDGFAVNTKGANTGSKIWANKNSMDAAHLSVTIDGTKIQ